MKFCYVDESGMGEEPVFVMAGIIADAARMHITKKAWLDFLNAISGHLNKPVSEFHTRHFYRGKGIWYDLNGEQRSYLMDRILTWLQERNHKIVFSAIDKAKAKAADWSGKSDVLRSDGLPNYWRVAALHLLLCLQKEHQRADKNKGNTVVVFDREVKEEHKLCELVLSPPDWSDSFYSYARNSKRRDNPTPLSQIVDVPYFADSRHVALLQVADLFAYLLRHHAELQAETAKEKYDGERSMIAGWVKRIGQLCLPDPNRWPAKGSCATSEHFAAIAPDALLRLHSESNDAKSN